VLLVVARSAARTTSVSAPENSGTNEEYFVTETSIDVPSSLATM
jgi:hypothetical protein